MIKYITYRNVLSIIMTWSWTWQTIVINQVIMISSIRNDKGIMIYTHKAVTKA